jgi:hypothetical protein
VTRTTLSAAPPPGAQAEDALWRTLENELSAPATPQNRTGEADDAGEDEKEEEAVEEESWEASVVEQMPEEEDEAMSEIIKTSPLGGGGAARDASEAPETCASPSSRAPNGSSFGQRSAVGSSPCRGVGFATEGFAAGALGVVRGMLQHLGCGTVPSATSSLQACGSSPPSPTNAPKSMTREELPQQSSVKVHIETAARDNFVEADDEGCRDETTPMPCWPSIADEDTALRAMVKEDEERNRSEDGHHPWQLLVFVPEGVATDRRVRVIIDNMELEAQVPEDAVCCVGKEAIADLPFQYPFESKAQREILHTQILMCRVAWLYNRQMGQYLPDLERHTQKVRAYRRLRGRCMAPRLSVVKEER